MLRLLSILLQDMNPGKATFGRPYDSTQGFTAKGLLIVFFIIIVFGLYVGLRVWWSLRKEKMNKK